MREGLVVASCGLYFSMAGRCECFEDKRKDKLLTGKVTRVADDNLGRMRQFRVLEQRHACRKQLTVPVAFSWSREEVMIVSMVSEVWKFGGRYEVVVCSVCWEGSQREWQKM
jgi:hypothetical protein